jgi:hypothetical protein
VVSSGGAVYMVAEEGEYRLYSHIVDREKNKELIRKLCSFLTEDGILAFAIQGPHKNYRQKIKGDIYYEQRIEKKDSYHIVDKWYTFSKPDGAVLTEQFCKFCFFDGNETSNIFRKVGCSQDDIKVVGNNFWVVSPAK